MRVDNSRTFISNPFLHRELREPTTLQYRQARTSQNGIHSRPKERSISHATPHARMRPDRQREMRGPRFVIETTRQSGHKQETITNCPNSTPPLNASRHLTKPSRGSPSSLSTFANPKPWINPNKNVIRHLCGDSSRRRFSIAT